MAWITIIGKRWFQPWTMVDIVWRVCTWCSEYKLRSHYSKAKVKSWHTPNCKLCRNKAKKIYRATWGDQIDKMYKDKRRKLPIWCNLKIKDEIWNVIWYEYKKWYEIKSLSTGYIRHLDVWDNPNKVKYTIYRL